MRLKLEELNSIAGGLESEVKQKNMTIENLTSVNKVKGRELDELKIQKEKLEKTNREINAEIISGNRKMEELKDKCECQEEEIKDLKMKNIATQEKIETEMKKSIDIHDQLAKEIEKQELV